MGNQNRGRIFYFKIQLERLRKLNIEEPREKGKYSYGKWVIKITFEVEFLFQSTIRKTKKTKY